MRKLPYALVVWPCLANAQTQGWGQLATEEETPFSWTAPLWPQFWMAWTPITLLLFVVIFGAIAVIGLMEGWRYPDGLERRGVLGLTTTLGDRLFITLLGTVYIFLAWIFFFGMPLWAPLAIAVGWSIFTFWKV